MIERKAAGEEVVVEASTPQTEQVADLMAALEASVQAAKKGTSGPRRRSRRPARKKSAA